ncbi:hypothetical protein FCL40_10235 [Ferrimonas sediminicola]|uniref:Uncharacterized protein n=1 Tax=Ferrimonas sediminicola TaxID=2569538 RepID=A0A4U1BD57_9GAMM|nr:hypothetical protein [Ferrimonas sediminicola]TKB49009.1 hypothetical protein FCL40_10235 [Ferrimonas sediminicola]
MIDLLIFATLVLLVAMVPVYGTAVLIRSPTPGPLLGGLTVCISLALLELSLDRISAPWGWLAGGLFGAVAFSLLFGTRTWRGVILATVLCLTYQWGTGEYLNGLSLTTTLQQQLNLARSEVWPE